MCLRYAFVVVLTWLSGSTYLPTAQFAAVRTCSSDTMKPEQSKLLLSSGASNTATIQGISRIPILLPFCIRSIDTLGRPQPVQWKNESKLKKLDFPKILMKLFFHGTSHEYNYVLPRTLTSGINCASTAKVDMTIPMKISKPIILTGLLLEEQKKSKSPNTIDSFLSILISVIPLTETTTFLRITRQYRQSMHSKWQL